MPDRTPLATPWWLLPLGRVHPLWWVAVGASLIAIDYLVGPDFRYPVVYVIPVILAAWYSGRQPAVALAVATGRIRLHEGVPTTCATLSAARSVASPSRLTMPSMTPRLE